MRSLWIFFFACLFFAFAGCAGNKPAVSTESPAGAEPAAVRDSLRAKFVLTLVDTAGKTQELDAVLFSVPGKRYRMELTGPMGVGVASLLWTESGWDIDILHYKANTLECMGYRTSAIDIYTEILSKSKDNVKAYLSRANLYRLEEKYEEAVADYEKALQLSDGSYQSYIGLYTCFLQCLHRVLSRLCLEFSASRQIGD
jgi:tetratricopeptide (TPR) repeat protein